MTPKLWEESQPKSKGRSSFQVYRGEGENTWRGTFHIPEQMPSCGKLGGRKKTCLLPVIRCR